MHSTSSTTWLLLGTTAAIYGSDQVVLGQYTNSTAIQRNHRQIGFGALAVKGHRALHRHAGQLGGFEEGPKVTSRDRRANQLVDE